MLFMNICKWSPKDNAEVVARRKEWSWPEGSKVVFEFVDLQGCRYINVVDADVRGLIAARAEWIDLAVFETFPIHPIGVSKGKIEVG